MTANSTNADRSQNTLMTKRFESRCDSNYSVSRPLRLRQSSLSRSRERLQRKAGDGSSIGLNHKLTSAMPPKRCLTATRIYGKASMKA